MIEKSKRKKEITLTKELAKRLQKKFSNYKIYANKSPSRSPKVKKLWTQLFRETCPPLQPEIDMIIWEPANSSDTNSRIKIRAIEIKYFKKEDQKINQSFYKGIEQTLALLQWGFDNVALWQFFDDSFSDADLRNYGCRTWFYIHGLLKLPIEFTPIRVIGNDLENIKFNVIQADWFNNLKPIKLLDIDDPRFNFTYRNPNPFTNEKLFQNRKNEPLVNKFLTESKSLRNFILSWLEHTPRNF